MSIVSYSILKRLNEFTYCNEKVVHMIRKIRFSVISFPNEMILRFDKTLNELMYKIKLGNLLNVL